MIQPTPSFAVLHTEPLRDATADPEPGAARAVEVAAMLGDSVVNVKDESLSETLTFVETLTIDKIKGPSEKLTFSDSIICNKTLNRTFSETLVFKDSIIRLPNPGNESVCSEGYVPSPVLGSAKSIALTYPYASPSTTILLRDPKFGNTDTLNTNTRYKRTRSGQLSVVRGQHWPTIELLKVSFEALTEQQASDFRNFISLSAAFEIGYLDQESRQWRGLLTNPVLETSPVGIGCQYTLSFEFRGRLA